MTIPPVRETNREDVEDPVEQMLKKTGCMELHYQLQECVAETQDWRKCQEQVQQFKSCMAKYQKDRVEEYK